MTAREIHGLTRQITNDVFAAFGIILTVGISLSLLATSGSSGFENALSDLKKSFNTQTSIKEGIVVHNKQNSDTRKEWIVSLGM